MANFIAHLFEPEVFRQLHQVEIVECRGFFVVERSLLNTSLPKNALTLAEFKAYLLHCRRIGGHKKTSYSATNDILRKGGIKGPSKREAAIEGLKEKCFIKELPRQKGKQKFEVLGVPLYNYETGEYIPTPYERNVKSMKKDDNGYIQVPNELVDEKIIKHLSGRQIKVLLKLYEYNRMELYGGVDPNIITVQSRSSTNLADLITGNLYFGGKYIVADRSLFEELYLTQKEFLKTLRSLVRKGLIKLESRRSSVDSNGRIIVHQNTTEGDEIYMLKPVYQIKQYMEAWRENNGL